MASEYQALDCCHLDELLTKGERRARDFLAAVGITYKSQSGRHLVNLQSMSTCDGTHDIQTLVVGADLTGIEAFR